MKKLPVFIAICLWTMNVSAQKKYDARLYINEICVYKAVEFGGVNDPEDLTGYFYVKEYTLDGQTVKLPLPFKLWRKNISDGEMLHVKQGECASGKQFIYAPAAWKNLTYAQISQLKFKLDIHVFDSENAPFPTAYYKVTTGANDPFYTLDINEQTKAKTSITNMLVSTNYQTVLWNGTSGPHFYIELYEDGNTNNSHVHLNGQLQLTVHN